MNPSHLAKGVGPDLYWASSFELHHFNEGQPDRGGRAIDDVYMYEIVIKCFYPLSNTSGYEGGRRGPCHPENADPGLASGDIELSTP